MKKTCPHSCASGRFKISRCGCRKLLLVFQPDELPSHSNPPFPISTSCSNPHKKCHQILSTQTGLSLSGAQIPYATLDRRHSGIPPTREMVDTRSKQSFLTLVYFAIDVRPEALQLRTQMTLPTTVAWLPQ
jgi:hypothetical protein